MESPWDGRQAGGGPSGDLSVNSMGRGTRRPRKSVTQEEASEAEAKAGERGRVLDGLIPGPVTSLPSEGGAVFPLVRWLEDDSSFCLVSPLTSS